MSNAITLKATIRTGSGKGAARQARRDGRCPAVVYGHGSEPRHILLEEHATRLALRGNENALINIDLEGQDLLAIVKDIQRHPIRPGVQHVDFLLVNRNERVDVEVPVNVMGTSAPGTIHMIELDHVEVTAPAIAIPEAIGVDITGVEGGTIITVADLALPEGVEAISDAELAVVNVTIPTTHDAGDAAEAGAGSEAAPAAE
ncbi:50S ribosomal protein L25/general stress protein Ctc [Actinomyces gaoshouyii]|uniref:Large ribosomal subunit protein bL25 n=1 Tax=Actinomyces gaoshouyii TaxID=1960083 RepID=A0A8H9LM28_9ACTO|nr:50S ribosomal protein L25/general stress protein Ctc [Actinomyces gaoshouyii]ARD41166.1 50S ribosomal protein L25/general stress protein Ctc [Actinomyces gaoshouyii]GGO99686.1 50S ribosomal protein L25 [Actinomyces gaoshouyii]